MQIKLSPFSITIHIDNKAYPMQVRQSFYNNEVEIFDVIYKERVIEIRSNRPLWRIKGVKKKKFECKVLNGQPKYQSTFEKIVEEIQSYIYQLEKVPYSYKDHPKNTGNY